MKEQRDISQKEAGAATQQVLELDQLIVALQKKIAELETALVAEQSKSSEHKAAWLLQEGELRAQREDAEKHHAEADKQLEAAWKFSKIQSEAAEHLRQELESEATELRQQLEELQKANNTELVRSLEASQEALSHENTALKKEMAELETAFKTLNQDLKQVRLAGPGRAWPRSCLFV